MKLKTLIYLAAAGLLASCASADQKPVINPIQETVSLAVQQIGFQTELIEQSGKIMIPRTIKNDKIHYVPIDDWTSGFFAGTMWYMYDLTGDEKWKTLGVKYTEHLDSAKYLTWHHDVGFMINCSYGNALRVTGDTAYKSVMMEAARSLATRYRPVPGVIQSWDEDRGWQGKRGWMCPVIIDNMMNLELFFEATRISGDSSFYKMAVSHADVTMAHHFRDDYSSYHVVDYDKIKGGVRSRETAQGYAHESAWARGQAWALYGYTVCYRETRDERYLKMAENIYNYLFNHPNMPADLVPYWDFDAPAIPNEPRDASAAAIIASALYELSTYKQNGFKETADKIVASLASPAYLAIVGTNHNFLLMHSVGSIPHGHEIDVPLNYADYYFLEALVRKQNIEKK
ncbi:MAG: glucuronyl hydrolase [Paludibacter sp. SCN 51-9]|nr:MAG: glucuronyl hydrolase [Paludibacter sp. SCN 51-9]